jgi:glycogen operon protein
MFGHGSRKPWASVNYVASHDGMTLEDLVSYAERHNQANGGDAGGHGETRSANWGAEGPSHDRDIVATRDIVKRSMLTTLFAALGTPMLLAGDEFGRTQNGNDNAYCQDNDISWVDWTLAESERGRALTAFAARLIQIRRAYPVLRSSHFLHGRKEVAPGILNIDWFDERGGDLSLHDWRNPDGRALVMRLAAARNNTKADLVAMAMNASAEALEFQLPGEARWQLLVDSIDPEKESAGVDGGRYGLGAHGAAIFAAVIDTAS